MTIKTILIILLVSWTGAILISSALMDMRARRIPNKLTLSTIIVALLVHGYLYEWSGILFSLQGLGVGFLFFFFPYCMRGMGAGDVKLAAAVGAVLGPQNTLLAMLFIALVGGGFSLFLMYSRGIMKKTLSRIWLFFIFYLTQKDTSILQYDKKELVQEGIPFAVAIAAGVFLYIIYVWRTTGMLPILGPS